jgi:hypothetical protein
MPGGMARGGEGLFAAVAVPVATGEPLPGPLARSRVASRIVLVRGRPAVDERNWAFLAGVDLAIYVIVLVRGAGFGHPGGIPRGLVEGREWGYWLGTHLGVIRVRPKHLGSVWCR